MKCKKNIIQEEIGRKIYLNDDNSLVIEYSDEINSNSKEPLKIKDIGSKFSGIASFFFDYLAAYNIPTAYKKLVNDSIQMQKHIRYPFFIKILNIIDKRTSRLFERKEGEFLSLPVFTFHAGTLALPGNDNMIAETHIISLDICPLEDLKIMKRLCSKVNAVLRSFFERRNLFLAEVNCSFGKDEDRILLIDYFTPMSFRIINHSDNDNSINPYKLKSPEDYKKYTDFMFNLTN